MAATVVPVSLAGLEGMEAKAGMEAIPPSSEPARALGHGTPALAALQVQAEQVGLELQTAQTGTPLRTETMETRTSEHVALQ
jgi:hypothetical protein